MGFSKLFVVVIKGLNILHFASSVAFPWEAKGRMSMLCYLRGNGAHPPEKLITKMQMSAAKLHEQDSLNLTSLGPKQLPKGNL